MKRATTLGLAFWLRRAYANGPHLHRQRAHYSYKTPVSTGLPSEEEFRHQVAVLVRSGSPQKVWKLALKIKLAHPSAIPVDFYNVLLQAMQTMHSRNTTVALNLYVEAVNQYKHARLVVAPVSVSQRRELWCHLLRLFRYCHRNTDLAALKLLRESEAEHLQLHQLQLHSNEIDGNGEINAIDGNDGNKSNINNRVIVHNSNKSYGNSKFDRKHQLLYHSAYIHTFLNCNQLFEAIDTFHETVDTLLHQGITYTEIVMGLPTKRLIHVLAQAEAWDELCSLLSEIYQYEECSKLLEIDAVWVQFLQGAVCGNHYELCKLLTDHYIMKDLGDAPLETVLFENSKNLEDLSDGLVMLIVQILSLNGDVMGTISLIETFYLHRNMRGERGLTKELSIDIIRAYCTFGADQNQNKNPQEEDTSMFAILDVINKFVVRFSRIDIQLSYKDIGDLLSGRFYSYRLGLELEKVQVNPNKHLDGHLRGNPFANLEVLERFVSTHLHHMLDNHYDKETIVLFVNCILNHVSTHQNLTGVITVLSSLYQINSQLVSTWALNDDLYLIILHALGLSSTSQYSGRVLYRYMKNKGILQPHHLSQFILSTIRLTHDQPLSWSSMSNLLFFLYEYLHMVNHIDMHVRDILENLLGMLKQSSNLRDTLRFVLGLQKVVPADVEEYWQSQGLSTELHELANDTNESKSHKKDIDLRDAKRLNRVLA